MNQTLMHMLHNGKYAKLGKYATYVKCKFGVLLFSHRHLNKQEICSLLFLKGNMFACVFDLVPPDRRPLLPWLWNLCCSILVHTHTHTNALTYIHTECSKCSILVHTHTHTHAHTHTYKRSHVHTNRMFKMFNIGARPQAHSKDPV